MIKHIILTFLITIIAACSTSVKKSDENKEAVELSKKYVEQIELVESQNKKGLNQLLCPTDKQTLKNKDWKQLIDFANACVNKKSWKTLEVISYLLTEESSFSPWGSYYLSLIAEHENHLDRAFWFVDLALKKAPGQAILYYQKARLQWKSHEYELSAENFEKAIELNSNLSGAHLFLAKINYRDQDLKIAEKHFDKVLQKDQRNFEALLGIIKVYQAKGDTNKEMFYLEKAQLVRPNNKWVKKHMSKYIAKAQPRQPATEEKSKHGGGQ
ncbi:MAG: hypothetical protein H6625_02220 [Bdellovibrionaceae bacterium]|nr:hypothetical protein [Pseudobdellovibrionaceae bacterium]